MRLSLHEMQHSLRNPWVQSQYIYIYILIIYKISIRAKCWDCETVRTVKQSRYINTCRLRSSLGTHGSLVVIWWLCISSSVEARKFDLLSQIWPWRSKSINGSGTLVGVIQGFMLWYLWLFIICKCMQFVYLFPRDFFTWAGATVWDPIICVGTVLILISWVWLYFRVTLLFTETKLISFERVLSQMSIHSRNGFK